MVMLELLRLQAQTQAQTLSHCVLELARDPHAPDHLNACASAARSFEGTAHMVGLEAGANLARTMDECFAAVRRGEIQLQQELIGVMLRSVDLLDTMARLAGGTVPSKIDAARTGRVGPKTKRVLVIDDSLEARELQRKLLSFRGYDVVTVVDGVEAWYAIRSRHFDLVLTDIDMPLINGIQWIRFLRKDPRFVRLPVLIACDNNSVQQRWQGFDAGADYYVIKARLHDTLVEAVNRLIGPP